MSRRAVYNFVQHQNQSSISKKKSQIISQVGENRPKIIITRGTEWSLVLTEFTAMPYLMLIHFHSHCFKNLKSKMPLKAQNNRNHFLEKKGKHFRALLTFIQLKF